MAIDFDPHARTQMAYRRITEAQVVAALGSPDRQTYKGAKVRGEQRWVSEAPIGDRWLGVAWAKRKAGQYVWTAYWVSEEDPEWSGGGQ